MLNNYPMFSTGLADSIAQLLILIPFLFFAKRKNKATSLAPFGYFVAIYIVSSLLIHSSQDTQLFPGQRWNWAGKGLAFVMEIMLAFCIPGFTTRQFGLTFHMDWKGTKPIILVCLIFLILRMVLYNFSGEAAQQGIHPETVLFQATLPGLQEELLFRGILLGLLNRMLPAPAWSFCKVSFGWGAILTAILFGAAHGIGFNGDHSLHLNYAGFFRTCLDGFLFALLVQKTKSIFPGVIFHNLLDLIGNH